MLDQLSIVDAVACEPMMVSWDLGRRCNYDCSYCPSHRHDNHSPLASLEDLKKSAAFMFDYLALIMPFKTGKYVSVSFTGGEPTVNPNFIKFGKWLREEHEAKYKHLYSLNLALTTNGATSQAMCDNLIANYNFATISYHCESIERFKKLVVDNILYLTEKKFPIKVNVMFHAREDYFNECKALCEKLAAHKIDFVPRMIGEYEGNDRYNHVYSDEQLAWMKAFWTKSQVKLATESSSPLPKPATAAITAAVESKPSAESRQAPSDRPKAEVQNNARSLGRPCCGKREMNVCSGDKSRWEKTNFLKFAHFKGWHCSVNWFFLHIEQQDGFIYHHQTCQANFGGKREPIGNIHQADLIINKLRDNLNAGTMPVITCPNKICGCGLCTPKAASLSDFKNIFARHVDQKIFANNPEFAEAAPQQSLL